MVAYDLAMQGAQASATMVLTCFLLKFWFQHQKKAQDIEAWTMRTEHFQMQFLENHFYVRALEVSISLGTTLAPNSQKYNQLLMTQFNMLREKLSYSQRITNWEDDCLALISWHAIANIFMHLAASNQTMVAWTHCGLVTPYGDTDLGQHWFR